jgi:A/G-specific adenine glycosylase
LQVTAARALMFAGLAMLAALTADKEEEFRTMDASRLFDVGGVLLSRPFRVRRLGHFGLNMTDTASAIASFAYNLPHAVVDGNVFRVFARFYGIATPIDTKEGIAIFNKIAFENLSNTQAGIYNQALMDFGATVCKPMAAQCPSCVMQKKCMAFTQNQVNLLPVKLKSIQKKNRFFDFFIFRYEDQCLIQKRGEGDIWSNLYQFYLIENERAAAIDKKYIQKFILEPLAISTKNIISQQTAAVYKQTLTHQQIEARFIITQLDKKPALFAKALWVKKEGFKKYSFPKIVNDFLKIALAKGKSGFSL